MALHEEWERTGNWLFRWRSYLPLVLFLLLWLGLRESTPRVGVWRAAWMMSCFGVSLAGLAIRIYTVGCTPTGTSGRNTNEQRAIELNSTGAYSVVRHPLYVGNFLMWLGVALYPFVWWVPVIFSLVFWLYYERIMFAEEEFLRRQFGVAYEAWAERTPAFIPRLSKWRPPSESFSLRKVLRREYTGMFGVIVIYTLLDARERWLLDGYLSLDPIWALIAAFGLVAYLSLRTMKHRTRWLHSVGS